MIFRIKCDSCAADIAMAGNNLLEWLERHVGDKVVVTRPPIETTWAASEALIKQLEALVELLIPGAVMRGDVSINQIRDARALGVAP